MEVLDSLVFLAMLERVDQWEHQATQVAQVSMDLLVL